MRAPAALVLGLAVSTGNCNKILGHDSPAPAYGPAVTQLEGDAGPPLLPAATAYGVAAPPEVDASADAGARSDAGAAKK